MSNVDFHEHNEIHCKYAVRHHGATLTSFLIDHHIARDSRQASHILVGVFITVISVIFALVYSQREPVPDVIITPGGTQLTPQQYVELVGQRKDPFKVQVSEQ